MRRRTLAILAHGARGAGVAAVFLASAAGGLVLHANTKAVRGAGAEIANRATASLFAGRIVVGEVEHLSLGTKSRVRVRAADILDPEGKRVVHVDGLEATIDLRALLGSIADGRGPAVELEDVRIASADVVLDRTPDGSINIARAFADRPSTRPAAPPKPTTQPTARAEPYLDISSVRIGHAHVRGNVVPPSLDGDADALKARVHFEHDVVRVDLDEGKTVLRSPAAPNQNAPITGAVKGALTVALAANSRLEGHADLTGNVGAVPIVAHAQIDDDVVDATVDVARVDVAPLAQAFAGLPFGRPVEAHARAHGKLPALAVDVRARVGESDIAANGEIDLRTGHAFKVDVDAKHVDASAYGAPLPTDITTKIHAEGVMSDGLLGVTGSYKVTTEDGTVGSEHLPAASIEGKLEKTSITATVAANEPGVSVAGSGSLELETLVATFDVDGRSASLRQLHRAPNLVGGAASVRARGTIDLRARTIDARTTLAGTGLAFDMFTARELTASGRLKGPLAEPILDASFAATELAVTAKNKKPLVYPSAKGRARVAFVPTVKLLSVSVDVGGPGDTNGIGASAANVSIANGVIEARGVSLTGLGEPLELDARVGEGGWSIRAKSAGVDLHRLARTTGIRELEVVPEGTRAQVDIDVQDSPSGATGHVDLVVTSEKGALLGGGVKLETHAVIEHGHLSGRAKIASEGLGYVEVKSAELDIPGRLDARSLARTTGTVELRGSFDLAQGGALIGGDRIERMSGIASFEARIERGERDAMPAVRATVKTAGLEVVYSEDPSKPSTTFAGIDLSAHVAWDGRTDDAELSVLSWDAHGVLGQATAKSKVPLLAWATGKEKLDRHALEKLEVAALAEVPRRDAANLPAFLGLPDLRGKLEARVTANGSVDHPTVIVSAHANNLRGERQRQAGPRVPTFEPLDVVLEAHWTDERAAITFALDERIPKRKDGPPRRAPGRLHGLAMVADLRVRDILYGRPRGARPWSAATEIEVTDLDVGALPLPVASLGQGRGLSGALTGRFRLRDLNRDASLQGQASVTNFGVGGATVSALDLTVFGRDASLFVHAKVTDKDSSAILQLSSQSARVDGLDFTWNTGAPSRLDYAVQNGNLSLVAPLVRRHVSEMEGRVNGTGSVTITDDDQIFEGGLALMGTSMYVNTLGEELSELTATARFDRSGTFVIEDARGKLGNGDFHAVVSGKMKGFSFQEAKATLTSVREGVPISSEGANFAALTGEVNLTAKMSADRSSVDVTIDVPRAEVSLPDRSTQQLEPLAPDPTVAIGLRRKNGVLDQNAVRKTRGGTGRSTTRTAASLVTKIDARLGDKVTLEGRDLDVNLGGRALIEIANEIAVTGQIDLKGGTAIVHGRRFTVDRGVIRFPPGGDPSNPTVVAAAYWTSPDHTRVWVEFVGPLKTGILTLRSEPAYSKNEILSLLLFGQPDPNMSQRGSTSKGSAAGGATAIGTGFVASDLNRVLSEIDENLDIETDTMAGNRARTKLGHTFFDRRLKVQLGVAPGQTYREPDTAFLFVNWQFIPKWSVVATRGNQGTSILDILFQHRY